MVKKQKEDPKREDIKDKEHETPTLQEPDKDTKKENTKQKGKPVQEKELKGVDNNAQEEGKDKTETDKKKDKKKKKDKSEPEDKELSHQTAPTTLGPYQLIDLDRKSESTFEDDDKFGDSFKDSAIRSKFIRKVYLILSVQLGFTTVFNIPFLHLDEVQEFIYDYPWMVFVALAVFVVPYFMLVCCESTRRSFPTNIILLLLMTLGMAGVCGYMTAKLDTEVVFYAFLLTVVVTLSITTLAIFCPFDFTKCLMVMCVVIIVLIVFAMIAVVIIILTKSKVVNLIYAGICVVLFSLFLMFDTQAIIGGRRVRLSPEEYILAAIQIYVDIVEIFLNFLELIGACTEND